MPLRCFGQLLDLLGGGYSKTRFRGSIAGLVDASEPAQQRMIAQYEKADPGYAARVAAMMGRVSQAT